MPVPSVPDVPRRALRLKICRMVIDVLKAIHADLFGAESNFGAELDTIMVGCAVLVGHAENRPMTARKLAHYLGMPRTTVQRKLDRLHELDAVFSIEGRYFITASRLKANAPLVSRLNHMMTAENFPQD